MDAGGSAVGHIKATVHRSPSNVLPTKQAGSPRIGVSTPRRWVEVGLWYTGWPNTGGYGLFPRALGTSTVFEIMYTALDHSTPIARVSNAPGRRRLIALVVAVCCAGLLGIATFVAPASAGVGTHEQLNLPQCGWITLMDLPCMTCGMTTAFSHAVRGSFLKSALTQPMGFVLAMGTAMTLMVALYVTMTGSNVTRMFARLWTPRMIWLIALFAAASWMFKIAMYRGMLA